MKKVITLLLLLIFCIEPACLATDVIIGADGQARYADGVETPLARDTKKETVKQEVVQDVKVEATQEEIKQEPVVPEVSIETKADLEKIVEPYKKKNLKIINNAEKEIDYQKALKKADLYHLQSSSYAKKFELQDGDYALWNKSNKGVQYAGEFHKDGSCMGIVKIQKIDKNTIVFYEYRSESNDAKKAPLKHIMIAYDDKHNASFIYNVVDKKLRSCLYDKIVYALDMPGYPELSKVNLSSIQTNAEKTGEAVGTVGQGVLCALAAPFVVAGIAVIAPFALLILIDISINGIDHH